MRSDVGEKHTALKKCFITPDYHGALTLLLLALPPAPIKSLILSASEKFFLWIFLVWRVHCVGGCSEPRLGTGHVYLDSPGIGKLILHSVFGLCSGLGPYSEYILDPSLRSPSAAALPSRGL